MPERLRIIGVYPVDATEPVHLIEVEYAGPDDLDFYAFTQEIEGQPEENWQAAYDKQELSSENSNSTKAVFFFHYLHFEKPFRTQIGDVVLPPETPMPSYLSHIKYETP